MNGFNTSSSFDITILYEKLGIQSSCHCTGMDTSLRDRLVRMRTPKNAERGGQSRGQTASTSCNIRGNKRIVEWLL